MTAEHWKKHETRFVSVDNIHLLDRIIYPTQARINAMAKSFAGDLGQIEPILIAKHLYSSWRVVTGATRYLAAKQNGWEEIEATVISADNDFEYQLIEIAENLHRHDLSGDERATLEAKQATLSAERLAYFDELMKPKPEGQCPPPTPAAQAPHRATGKPRGRPKAGVNDAARKAGVPRVTAQRRVKKTKGGISAQVEWPGRKSPSDMLVKLVLLRAAISAKLEAAWIAATDKDRSAYSHEYPNDHLAFSFMRPENARALEDVERQDAAPH